MKSDRLLFNPGKQMDIIFFHQLLSFHVTKKNSSLKKSQQLATSRITIDLRWSHLLD